MTTLHQTLLLVFGIQQTQNKFTELTEYTKMKKHSCPCIVYRREINNKTDKKVKYIVY